MVSSQRVVPWEWAPERTLPLQPRCPCAWLSPFLGQLRVQPLPSSADPPPPHGASAFQNPPATLTLALEDRLPVCLPGCPSCPARPPGPSLADRRSHLPPERRVSGRSCGDKLGMSAQLSAESNICLPAVDRQAS